MDNMAQIDCHFFQTIYWHMNYKGMTIHWHDKQFIDLLDWAKYWPLYSRQRSHYDVRLLHQRLKSPKFDDELIQLRQSEDSSALKCNEFINVIGSMETSKRYQLCF